VIVAVVVADRAVADLVADLAHRAWCTAAASLSLALSAITAP
jgi:hypothetical protein